MKHTVHIGHRGIALRVCAIYFIAAAAWIVGSDLVMLVWLPESAPLVAPSIAKGLLFVLVTSAVLYSVLHYVARMEAQPVRALAAERDAVGKRLDLLSRFANDVILLVDAQGRIAQANERAFERYGYAREELIGMPVEMLRPPEARASLAAVLEQSRRGTIGVYETTHVTRGGERFPVEISARGFEVDGARYLQAVIRDVTERKQAETQIRRLNRTYAVLSAINSAIVRVNDRDTLLREVCRIAHKKGGFPIAWAGVIDRGTSHVEPLAWRGVDEEYVRTLRRSAGSVAPGEGGVVGLAVRSREPVVSNDIASDPRLTHGARAAERGSRALVVLPLLVANEAVGVLALHARETGFFDEQEMRLMRELAGDLSFKLGTLERDRALEIAHERLELVTEGAGVGVWDWWDVSDPSRLWWSTRTYELLGLEPGRIAPDRRTFLSRIHPDDRAGVEAALRDALRRGTPYEVEYRVQADLGRSYWLRSRGNCVRDASGKVVRLLGVMHDIDVRKRAEEAVRESEQRFRAIFEQSITGTCIIDAGGSFVYVNPRLVQILGYESERDIVGRPVLADFVAPESRALVAENLRQRIAGEAQTKRYHFEALRRDGTRVTLGAHGTIGTYGGKRVIIATVQDVTELRRAEEEIERKVAQLEQAMHSTIDLVATIGELRDPYTHGHERRVGELAAAIAAEMGLEANRVEGVRIAGYLHDVGKIGVPAEILAKPARLSRPEFDLVKEHAQQGYEILKAVEFPWPVAQAAWQHHERLDGSGYPRGLKGEEIILEARILAVADVIEAMSSHRPYRPGHGIDAALVEIEHKRGSLFDPGAVDACLRLFREKGYRLPA
ncbi:MAG: PAS domain S-box protein [Pseudomonadota bacterium]